MPISKTFHNEKRQDKMPVYIVRMKNEIDRVMLGVRFIRGVGRTKFPERAHRFSEEFGYEVQLPVGVKCPWTEVDSPHAEHGVDYASDDAADYAVEEEEEASESDSGN